MRDRRPHIAEFLRALPGVDLGRVDVALGVDCEIVHPVEFAGVAAVASERADHRAVVAHEGADLIVGAVGIEQVGLLAVDPEVEVPDRACSARRLLVGELLHEAAVLVEHLDAVVRAIADIDQPILGDLHAVHGVAELGRVRIVGGELLVGRFLAVGAPVSLVGAGVGVEHDHTVVEIAVGDVDLVGLGIDLGIRRLAQPRHIVAVGLVAWFADLQHKLAVARELQILAILGAIAADPDETLGIDADAVLVFRPVAALPGAAPGIDELAVLVEFHHRGCGRAALAGRRIERCGLLVIGERARPLDHPDVVLRIDRHAGRLTHDPVVGERLRPGGIDLEARDIVGQRRRSREGGQGEHWQREHGSHGSSRCSCERTPSCQHARGPDKLTRRGCRPSPPRRATWRCPRGCAR